ncbi:MAG: Clp protease N-terminal domain-containing protein, partial [Planctomycetota bacterium]
HEYLGTEHLLLAIIAGADAPLAAVLSRHNITGENVKRAVLELLKRAPAVEDGAEPVRSIGGPVGARWDSEAVGVPRRFGTAVLMLLVTMYAVLFASMQSLDFPPAVFIVVAVLFTGVGLGQILLFSGRYPRAASIWVGACLFPAEILVVLLWAIFFPPQSRPHDLVPLLVVLLVLSIPLGAGLGYLAGGLTAGVFLLIERYKKYREGRPAEGE